MYFLTGNGSFFFLIIMRENMSAKLNTGASHPPKSPMGVELSLLAITLKRNNKSIK